MDYGPGDTVELVNRETGTKEKQRIVKTICYPDNPLSNTCEFANRTASFEELQQEQNEVNSTVNNITADDGKISPAALDFDAIDIHVQNIYAQELNAIKARIGDLEVTTLKATTLIATTAKIEQLFAEKATIQELNVAVGRIAVLETGIANINTAIIKLATIEQLNAANANIEKLLADNATINQALILKADIKDLKAIEARITTAEIEVAKIGTLSADVADIKTLVNGNLTSVNIQAGGITSDSLTIRDGFITNAMIGSVAAGKITTGVLNTSLVTIQGADGRMAIKDNTIQIKDAKRVRVQIGKDAAGDYSMYVWDKNGGLMFDAIQGLHAPGIKSGIIRNDMVADNANISGKKIDIQSLVTTINGGTTKIDSSVVQMDSAGQTLKVAFSTMTNTVNTVSGVANAAKSASETNTTAINVQKGRIDTLIQNTTIVKDGKTVQLKDEYNKTVATVDGIQTTITNLTNDLNNLSIGGRNLIKESDRINVSSSDYPTMTTRENGKITVNAQGRWNAYKAVHGLFSDSNYIFKDCSEKDFSFSVDVKTNMAGASASIDFRYTNTQKPLLIRMIIPDTGSKWIRISGTGKLENDVVATASVIIFGGNNQQGLVLEYRNFKLELGNKATDWTPAPEDAQGQITEVKTQQATFNQSLQGLQNSYTSLNQTVQQKADGTTVTAVTNRVGTLESGLNGLKSTVSSLQSTVNTKADNSTVTSLNTKVTTLESSLNGFKSTVSDTYVTKATFNALEIGGRNRIRYSDFSKTLTDSKVSVRGSAYTVSIDTSNKYDGKNSLKIVGTAAGISGNDILIITTTTADKGKHFVISFWAKASVTGALTVRWGYDGTPSVTQKPTLTTEWKYFTFAVETSRIPQESSGIFIMYDRAATFWIALPKLEEGTKATAWTPAPEDINADILAVDSKFTSYSTTIQMNSAIDQSKTNILSTVSNSYATKAQLTTVDGKFANYATTAAMNSAIDQKSNQILSTVSSTYATKTTVNNKMDKTMPDTRSTNQNPQWYFTNYPRQTITEFKYANVIGIGSSSYGTLETKVPWTENSGGYPVQTFRSNSTATYERRGTSNTEWSAWKQIEDTAGAQAKADTVKNYVISNYSTTTAMNSAIDQKSNQILSTVSSTYTTKTEFNNLEIGGRNLIKQSELIYLSGSDYPTITTRENGKITVNAQGGWNAYKTVHGLFSDSNYVFKDCVGKDFAYSVDVKTNKSGAYASIDFRNGTQKPLLIRVTLPDTGNKWVRISGTGKLGDSVTATASLVVFGGNNQQGLVLEYKNFKLEFGNKATDWTPAPEDVDESITAVDSKFGSYSTTTQMNSAIDQKANQITQTVSQTYTTKTEFNNSAVKQFNNFSRTGNLTGWSPLANESGLNGVKLQSNDTYYQVGVITTTGNTQVYSDFYEVDANKSYRIGLTVHKPAATGTIYFGITCYNASKQAVGVYTGTSSTLSTNFYYYSTNAVIGGWSNLEGYLMASNIDRAKLPKGKNVSTCAVMHPTTKYVRIRFLNYYNNGTSNTMYFAHPFITEAENNQGLTDTSIITVTNKAATLETSVNGITSRVTAVETKATTTANGLTSLTTRVSTAEQKLTATSLITTITTGINGGTKFTTTKFTMDNTGLTIKGGGIKIQNNAGDSVLYGDTSGNIVFGGTLSQVSTSTNKTGIEIKNGQIKMRAWQNGDIAAGRFIGYGGGSEKGTNFSIASGGQFGFIKSDGYYSLKIYDNGWMDFFGHPYFKTDLTNKYGQTHSIFIGSDYIYSMILSGNPNWYIHCNTNIGAYGINIWASDGRMKANIQPTQVSAVDEIARFKHRAFQWKDGGHFEKIGYIAQEMQQIDAGYVERIPQKDQNGNVLDYRLQINEHKIIPLLTKAVQELTEENRELRRQIEYILQKTGIGSVPTPISRMAFPSEYIPQYPESIRYYVPPEPEPIQPPRAV